MADSEQDALRRVPILQGLSAKELRKVVACAKEKRFDAGTEVVTQGKPGGPFFVILDGKADLLVDGSLLKALQPGEIGRAHV